jgi:hypothetical protein
MTFGPTELVTTTLRKRTKKIQDNVTNHNILLLLGEKHGMIEKNVDGRSLFEEVSFDQNDTFVRYFGDQVISLNSNQVLTALEYEPKQAAVAITITGRDQRMNAGELGLIKLVKARMNVAESTLANNINADLFSDGALANQMGGLKLIISKTPSTGSIGGLDRSVADGAFLRNYKFDTSADWAGGATSAANIKSLYTKVKINTQQNLNGPKCVIAGKDHYGFVSDAAMAVQYLTDPKLAELGYENIKFAGLTVTLGASVNFGGQTLIQDDLSYFVDPKSIRFQFYTGAYFEPLEKIQSINQDTEAQLIIMMGNATANRFKTNGVLFDS